jgi:hypothetical protein
MSTKGKYELFGRRLGIKLVSDLPIIGQDRRGYRFEFPALMIENRRSRRCYPGARFYASSFGAIDREEAWRQAIQQFALALEPVFNFDGKPVTRERS